MLKTDIGFQDVSSIEWDSEQAGEILTARDSGDVVHVHPGVLNYFMGVLPPRAFLGRGAFIFCEGDDFPTLFRNINAECYCLRAQSNQNRRHDHIDWNEYAADMNTAWSRGHIADMQQIVEKAYIKDINQRFPAIG